MRTIRTILVLCCLLGVATAAQAQRSLAIEDFAADVRVNVDGTVGVVETVRARFTGSWNGIYRTIPVEYKTPQGFDYVLRLDLGAITDGEGRPLKYESSRERHYLKVKIWVPGAVNDHRIVVIRYVVRNGLKFFDEHDELYWNVTGDEWEVPIERARASLHLPAGAAAVRTASFTGGYGSQESATRTSVAGPDITVESSRPLNFREGLTVAVAWAPGLIVRPTAGDRALAVVRDNAVLTLPGFVFAVMWVVWYRHGRDPKARPVTVAYEPPERLTPAEIGTLADNSPDMRDITASIVDLAVRGYIRIRSIESDRFLGLGTKTDYALQLQRASTDWADLRPHEATLLSALFSTTTPEPGVTPAAAAVISEVEISSLRNQFYKSLPSIHDAIFDRLVSQGYYVRRPDHASAGIYAAAGIAALGGAALVGFFDLGIATLMAVLASALVVGLFGRIMPARTVEGARVLDGVRGFEEFLSRVEADRLERVVRTPEMFERFLPFAMALGVESSWARAFEGIYTRQPDWYAGTCHGTFGPRMFAASLSDLSSDTGAAMSAAPRSSGGLGFSGGSSGGGFGGGGGGGF